MGVIMRVGICDKNGIPYTPERLSTEPELAHEFMEAFESMVVLGQKPYWRELAMDDIIRVAIKGLKTVEDDLTYANILKEKNKIQ